MIRSSDTFWGDTFTAGGVLNLVHSGVSYKVELSYKVGVTS